MKTSMNGVVDMSEACWLYRKTADWIDRGGWKRIAWAVFCVLLPGLLPSLALERWIVKQRKLTGRDPSSGDGFYSLATFSSLAFWGVVLLFVCGVWKL